MPVEEFEYGGDNLILVTSSSFTLSSSTFSMIVAVLFLAQS